MSIEGFGRLVSAAWLSMLQAQAMLVQDKCKKLNELEAGQEAMDLRRNCLHPSLCDWFRP